MAEENDQDEGAGLPPEDEGPSRLPQFIILIAVILIGQAAAAYVLITYVFVPKLLGEDAESTVEVTTDERPVFDIEEQLLFPLEDIVLNPPDNLGEIRFLTARVILKVDTPEALAELEDGLVASKIRDQILTLLGGTMYQDMNEKEERDRLRQRVKEHVNALAVLETGEVTEIYFERFILQ